MNFFSKIPSILKKKKIILFVFLFFIFTLSLAAGVNVVHADCTATLLQSCECNIDGICGLVNTTSGFVNGEPGTGVSCTKDTTCGATTTTTTTQIKCQANGSPGCLILLDTNTASQKSLNSTFAHGNPDKFAGTAILFSLIYLGTAFTFLYLSVILIARYAILIMLFILSPIAFAFWVFPNRLKKYQQEWWENFIKWCFVGVFASFVLWIASILVQQLSKATTMDNASLIAISAEILIFLYVGFYITAKQTGIASMAGNAIIGLAKGATGLAMGAVGGVAAVTGLKGLAQRGTQGVTRGLTRAGEYMNLIPKGTANLQGQAQLQAHESEKRAATWSADQRKKLATSRAMTTLQRNDKTEAIKQMTAKGELGSLSASEQQVAVGYAATRGVSHNDMSKGDYRAAEHDSKRVRDVMSTRGLGTGPAAETAGKEIVRHEQLERNLSSMSGEQRRNIDKADITGDLLTSDKFNSGTVRDFKTADSDRRLHLKTLAAATGPGTLNDAIVKAAADSNTSELNRLNSIKTEIIRLPT
jgi:hypothetical protein